MGAGAAAGVHADALAGGGRASLITHFVKSLGSAIYMNHIRTWADMNVSNSYMGQLVYGHLVHGLVTCFGAQELLRGFMLMLSRKEDELF